jgi:UPF0716 protein FxsA
MPWLFLLFVLVPATELYLLIQLSNLIGGFETFGVVVATGLLGSYMAKSQGMAVWTALNKKLSTGQVPGDELTDGAIILVSGTLLITPGVLTDVVGFLGLIPWTRALYRLALKRFLKGRSGVQMSFGGFAAQQSRPESHSHAAPEKPFVSGSAAGFKSAQDPTVLVSGKAKTRPDEKPVLD